MQIKNLEIYSFTFDQAASRVKLELMIHPKFYGAVFLDMVSAFKEKCLGPVEVHVCIQYYNKTIIPIM